MLPLTLAAVLGLVAIHLFADKLRFLDGTPRSAWLSVAGGISVSYVFLHLLPELARGQVIIGDAITGPLKWLEHHSYLVALGGLTIFYGLERAAKISRNGPHGNGTSGALSTKIFWIHLSSFLIYNVLVGYLVVENGKDYLELAFFFTAMALHFIVTDYGLREHYREKYAKKGRWLLSFGVFSGWSIGITVELSELVISVLVALLAGGVILNVLKEELPEERKSRFSAFLIGAFSYGALLLTL